MQLAAPSLPVSTSAASSAANGSDSSASVRSGKNSASRESFEKLLADDKRSAHRADKKSKGPADSTAQDGAALLGWTQLAPTPPAAPASILAGGTAAAPAEGNDAADGKDAASSDNVAAAAVAPGCGAVQPDLAAAQISLTAANAAGANLTATTEMTAAAQITATTKMTAPTKVPNARQATDGIEPSNLLATTAAVSPSPMTALKTGEAFVSPKDKSTLGNAKNSEESIDALALNTSTETSLEETPLVSPQGIAAKTEAASLLDANPIVAAQLTAEQALTSTLQSRPSSTAVIPGLSPKAIGVASSLRAKIAPNSDGLAAGPEKTSDGLDKNFLNNDDEPFAKEVSVLGTDTAKASANMSPASAHSSVFAANDRDGLSAVTTTSQANADLATSAASDAHRAVDAVLVAGERLSATGQGVNLQFNLGSADLAVRVEMRGGELHATFRTNSPELRSALATEWQSAAAQDAASPLHMVEPTFTGSNSSNLADQSQNFSSAQDRNSNAKNPSASDFNFVRSFSGQSDEGSTATPEPRSARPSLGYNQHLHVFA